MCWGQNRSRRNQCLKVPENYFSIKNKKRSQERTEKLSKILRISSSKQTNLIIEHRFSSAVRRVGPVQFGEQPSWTQHGFSSAVRRAGPNTDSAWPFAEMDPRRIQLGRSPSWTSPVWRQPSWGRAGPNTDSARPFAEQDQPRIQFGRLPSWTSPVRRMAELDP